MENEIIELFTNQQLVLKIQDRLPKLFHLAELECCRAGKIGMEVGSVREKVLIALLIYKFGQENVDTEIPITESEVDVRVFGNPISIKTITNKHLAGTKLIWTVDTQQALLFSERYEPSCDLIYVHINWGQRGGCYLFRTAAQMEIFRRIGRRKYIKLPKAGTNPRGVEVTTEAIRMLADHKSTSYIPIDWRKQEVAFDPYKKWVDMWRED